MTDPFSLPYSDDNKKNTFNNGGNNGHGLKNVTCKQNFSPISLVIDVFDRTVLKLNVLLCFNACTVKSIKLRQHQSGNAFAM